MQKLSRALWQWRARRAGYVRVAGLTTIGGVLIVAGSYEPLTRSNVDYGLFIVDASGDLWWRSVTPKPTEENQRRIRRLMKLARCLTPSGHNCELYVGFGSDDALSYICDSLKFREVDIKLRRGEPYSIPSAA